MGFIREGRYKTWMGMVTEVLCRGDGKCRSWGSVGVRLDGIFENFTFMKEKV